MTGKTTRAIDKAVQALFTDGKILVQKNRTINRKDIDMYTKRGYHVAIDPYCDLGKAQEDFAERLFRRLDSEHRGRYTISNSGSFYTVKKI